MNSIIFAVVLLIGVEAGIIHHEGLEGGDHRATSYQNIHMEHFHAVPTYLKKEDHELLKHPIPIGKSSSKVEVHHGGKHDHGYALAHVDNDVHGHGHGLETASFGGGYEGQYGGHDLGTGLSQDHAQIAAAGYQVQESADYSQYAGHDQGGYEGGADLGQYQYQGEAGGEGHEELAQAVAAAGYGGQHE